MEGWGTDKSTDSILHFRVNTLQSLSHSVFYLLGSRQTETWSYLISFLWTAVAKWGRFKMYKKSKKHSTFDDIDLTFSSVAFCLISY